MGCAISKQKQCPNCQNTMTRRSYSMHEPHVVAFSSTTLSSLKLENIHFDNKIYTTLDEDHDDDDDSKNDVSMGLIEAKTWSNMINEKIPKIVPKTPIRTPPGEPENINVWEVMEGLDDVSPYRSSNRYRSFSFDVGKIPICDSLDQTQSGNSQVLETNDSNSAKPFWLQTTDLDPEIISSIRRSLQELPPDDPFNLQSPEPEKQTETPSTDDINNDILIKEKDKVVVYFTSLRGVRKTYEDCCNVRVILKAIGARVDERDVSMDSGFKQELKELLGEGFNKGGLPKVFVGENYIGGVDEIRKLHEDGKLEKLLEKCEKVDGCNCEVCGDVRFVPCERCSGSCKIYHEANIEEEEEEKEDEEEDYGFQRCPDCNENGLIRCPICCS